MNNKIFIICFCFMMGFDNETLVYDISFMGINAGEAVLTIKKDTINQNNLFHLHSKTKTNSFVDKLYKIRDHVDIFFNQDDFSTIQVIKKIHQGGEKRFFKSKIDYDSLKAISNNKTIKIPGKVLDPLSSIYYLRDKDIKILDIFEFTTYDNDKLKDIRVVAKGIETVSTLKGEYECIMIIPESKNGTLLKNKGSMKIWLSNDLFKIPVKIENITKNGNLTMLLKEIR